jgi:hypothetical protein
MFEITICKQQSKQSNFKHPVVISSITVGAVHMLNVPRAKWIRIIRPTYRIATCCSISAALLAILTFLSTMNVNWLLQIDWQLDCCNQPVLTVYIGMLYLLTLWNRVLLEKLTWFSNKKNCPHVMETKGLLQHSDKSETCPYPEPAISNPHVTSHFLNIHLNILVTVGFQPLLYWCSVLEFGRFWWVAALSAM